MIHLIPMTQDNGDVILCNSEMDNAPVAILKSFELSEDMRELMMQGYVLEVCQMVKNMRRFKADNLELMIEQVNPKFNA